MLGFEQAVRLQQTLKSITQDFLGGPVVKNSPSNTGDVGSIPVWGPKIPHATDK